MTKTKGFDEWSKSRISIGKDYGCLHNCQYCFVAAAARRYRGPDYDFNQFTLDPVKVARKYQKRKHQPVICFKGHDVFPEIVEPAAQVVERLLKVGNQVLLVQKPWLKVWRRFRQVAATYKDRVEFRATITTLAEPLAKIYEPGAPAPSERLEALKMTFREGFKTSVVIEPFLCDPVPIIRAVYLFADSIWVGPMNNVPTAHSEVLKPLYEPEALKLFKHRIDAMDFEEKVIYKDAFLNRMNKK